MRHLQLFLKRFSKLSVGKAPQMAKRFHGGTKPEKLPSWRQRARSPVGPGPRSRSPFGGAGGAVRYNRAWPPALRPCAILGARSGVGSGLRPPGQGTAGERRGRSALGAAGVSAEAARWARGRRVAVLVLGSARALGFTREKLSWSRSHDLTLRLPAPAPAPWPEERAAPETGTQRRSCALGCRARRWVLRVHKGEGGPSNDGAGPRARPSPALRAGSGAVGGWSGALTKTTPWTSKDALSFLLQNAGCPGRERIIRGGLEGRMEMDTGDSSFHSVLSRAAARSKWGAGDSRGGFPTGV